MSAAPFVHLHVHSEYSILDGACRIPDLVARAAEFEMPAVSLTDHGSMAGAVQLFKETRGTGVKPIVGCEVYVADDRRAQTKGNAHLTLLAADNDGYSNLIHLSSLGYLEGYYYKPPAAMAEDFPGHADAMRRTLEVAERCNVELALGNILLPTFPVPENREAFDYLVELCEKGLQKRYGQATPELNERLQFEL